MRGSWLSVICLAKRSTGKGRIASEPLKFRGLAKRSAPKLGLTT